MNYWKSFYNNDNNVNDENLQKNVGRTVNGVIISDDLWNQTIDYIDNLLVLKNEDFEMLELCCGNGQIIGNLASKCKNAIGVDYSSQLLNQLEVKFNNTLKTIESDVLDISFNKESFDRIIIYFSLQYFNEKEVIQIILNCMKWLKKGGKLFLGDIPNEIEKWNYIKRPEYIEDYMERVLNGEPKIGNWFNPKFFKALENFIPFDNHVQIITQPSYQINSSYRFDVLIDKC